MYAVPGLPSVFAGWTAGDLSTLNPLTVKLRNGVRTITYSYVVVAGCSDGSMYDTLQAAIARTTELTGISFVKVSSGADVQLRATCGVDAANVGVTGAVVGDLYPGWPYQSIVNINTVMATYPAITQESIWLHEMMGHGLSSADEQYRKDGTFASTGLVSYMNTGPLSRVLWPQADIDRWSRVVYDIEPPPACTPVYVGFDDCAGLWRYLDGWNWSPATGVWHDPRGIDYGPCNKDGLRWSDALKRWKLPGANDGFDPSFNAFAVIPAC